MTVERPESGSISFSGVLAILALAGGIFLGVKLLPPYIGNYELQDSLSKLALAASYSPMSEDDIRKGVLSRANGYGIDLPPKAVSVNKEGNTITIAVDYMVPVDLFVKKVELHFEPSAVNHHF